MPNRRLLAWSGLNGALLASALFAGGCLQVLGLDEFKDDGSGGAGTGASSSTTTGSQTTGSNMSSSSTGMTTMCTPGTTVDCYTGPAGTENVGPCRHGSGVCRADGMGVEMCNGQVLPGMEDFNQKGDENCDGFASSEATLLGEYPARAMAADDMKNVYLGGTLVQTLTIGPDTLTVDEFAVFAGKLAPTGAGTWARLIGEGESNAFAASVDSMGNEVLVGGVDPATFWDPSATMLAGFVGKISPAGDPLWGRTCIGSQTISGTPIHAVAVDPGGNIIVAGIVYGSVDCGAGLQFAPNAYNLFVSKFSGAGTPIWTRVYHDTNNGALDKPPAIATDSQGNIWFTGVCKGSVNFGASTLTCGAAGDAFLVKLSPGGMQILGNRYGDSSLFQAGTAIAVSNDSPIVVFTNSGSIDVGGGSVNASAVLAKFSDQGVHQWSQPIQGNVAPANSVGAGGIVVDAQGNGTIVGSFTGAIDLGGGVFTAVGARDGFLWHFDGAGTRIYAKHYPALAAAGSVDLSVQAADKDGAMYVTGYRSMGVDYGTLSLPGSGYFQLRIDP